MTSTQYNDESKTRTNADILDETYFEYHGKYDDGNSPADEFDSMIAKGATLV